MPHVTFIHGIANKPPVEDLRRIWIRALTEAVEPISLSDAGITTSMVYWADLLYAAPVTDLSSYESTLESTPASIDAAGNAQAPVPVTAEQARLLEGLRAKLTTMTDGQIAAAAVSDAAPSHTTAASAAGSVVSAGMPALERIPLPWAIKREFMNAFLRDVHHYLFDVSYAPPGRQPAVPIQQTIRKRFVEVLGAKEVSRPHIVVSHSMGTLIAYDCLKRVDACNAIDGLLTIGSPLGLDEVQDKLQPEWSRANGFPSARLQGRWVNLYDHLDPVCGFDPRLANDYQKDGASRIEDVEIVNSGWWRHSATKYLRQPQFCGALREMLKV